MKTGIEKILNHYGKSLKDMRLLSVGETFYYSVLSEPGEETSGVFVLEGKKIAKDAVEVREGYAEFRDHEPSFGDIEIYRI